MAICANEVTLSYFSIYGFNRETEANHSGNTTDVLPSIFLASHMVEIHTFDREVLGTIRARVLFY
jgi:hypothetical protein